MAIEAVLSLAVSLIVAVAAITVYGTYRGEVMDAIEDRHATIVRSQVLTSVYNLKDADSGSSISLSLPEPEDSSQYRIAFDDRELVMETGDNERRIEVNGADWANKLTGSTTETDIKILKLNGDILLRPE
jgi:hypothetical protein